MDQATCPQVIFPLTYSDIFAAFFLILFSDRILEAEKICDKQEMEQFPNEGDDIQVEIYDIRNIYKIQSLVKYSYTDTNGIKQVFSI